MAMSAPKYEISATPKPDTGHVAIRIYSEMENHAPITLATGFLTANEAAQLREQIGCAVHALNVMYLCNN